MDELLQQGFELMVVGMGTVFFFLTLLVIATSAMSSLIRRFFEVPVPALQPDSDQAHVAAIAAAIAQHRQRRGQHTTHRGSHDAE
jgi:oxaloacetate decarboxylase gamma subunit